MSTTVLRIKRCVRSLWIFLTISKPGTVLSIVLFGAVSGLTSAQVPLAVTRLGMSVSGGLLGTIGFWIVFTILKLGRWPSLSKDPLLSFGRGVSGEILRIRRGILSLWSVRDTRRLGLVVPLATAGNGMTARILGGWRSVRLLGVVGNMRRLGLRVPHGVVPLTGHDGQAVWADERLGFFVEWDA